MSKKNRTNKIIFEEVSQSSGISNLRGEESSFWGDFNGDGWPDLLSGWHGQILYQNNRDGTFTDVTSEIFLPDSPRDNHGAAWADFDNDGDRDLVRLVGAVRGTGSGEDNLYVNDGGKLSDQASELGIDYSLGRGRTPSWVDYDNDGLLDLVMDVALRDDGQAPPTIFHQTKDGFKDVGSTIGFKPSRSTAFSILSDLSGDGKLDLFSKSEGFGQIIYDLDSQNFIDITANLLPNINISSRDIAIADFNNDLLPDIYSTVNSSVSELRQQGANNALAWLGRFKGDEQGIEFGTAGDVTFTMYIPSYDPPIPGLLTQSEVYVGASGIKPIDESASKKHILQFTLSPTDPGVEGIFPHESGTEQGVYIGYDPIRETWQLLFSTPERFNLPISIQSTESLLDVTAIGFDPAQNPPEDQLFLNSDLGLVDKSDQSGINEIPNSGVSTVAGDFDNDMDLDLYVVTTGTAANSPNILYENQGDGTFIAVPDAGGAAGTTLGIGSKVTTADYDRNGFLDLLVTNKSQLVENLPYELFHNLGNENNWLKIDLEGVKSNRDGIGAQIFATAGGVTQLREQTSSIHNGAQNHQRIHFGLADNTKVDELLIRWPSGQEQTIKNVPANQLLHIIEPFQSLTPEKPIYNVGEHSGVFLWKDTFDGPYHLRSVGGGSETNFEVKLISTETLPEVTSFSLESSDSLETTDFGFSYVSSVGSSKDGVDFRLAPGAEALLSVTQDGVANPRQISVGSEGERLSPAGWILSSDEFPVRPSFKTGEDLGLFVGQGKTPDVLEFRWNGDDQAHHSNLSVIASKNTANFSPMNLELKSGQDRLTEFSNGVNISGDIGSFEDGLDVATTEKIDIGFSYQQDSLTQPERVNPDDDLLGLPNAYQVPLANPYGQPEYNQEKDKGLFLWKDDQESWHLRVTAGGEGKTRYVGSIISDSEVVSTQGIEIERGDDIINASDPFQIDFDLGVSSGGQDGIDFSFPVGASLSLNLNHSIEKATELVQIGSEKWPIASLPIELSGW